MIKAIAFVILLFFGSSSFGISIDCPEGLLTQSTIERLKNGKLDSGRLVNRYYSFVYVKAKVKNVTNVELESGKSHTRGAEIRIEEIYKLEGAPFSPNLPVRLEPVYAPGSGGREWVSLPSMSKATSHIYASLGLLKSPDGKEYVATPVACDRNMFVSVIGQVTNVPIPESDKFYSAQKIEQVIQSTFAPKKK